MEIPSITIFVRHSADCAYRDDETYRKCRCKKHLRWTHNGKQFRQSAKARTWTGAEEAKRGLEAQFANNNNTDRAPRLESTQPNTLTTISDATASFMMAKSGEGVGVAVTGKYACELARFEQFMAKRSKFYPAQITLTDLVEYRATWKGLYPSALTRAKVQERLKAFLRFACKENLVDLLKLKAVKIKPDDLPEAAPFTEAELLKLLAQIPKSFAGNSTRIARLTALIHVMASTGMAIIDACKLEKENLENGWLVFKRHKTGRLVQQKLDPALRQELMIVKNGNPEYVFWTGNGKLTTMTTNFSHDLRQLMKDAGVYNKGNLAHRFRDTAADFWFGKGLGVTEVAAMLGDTEAVVEKHYKSLVTKIKERLVHVPQRTW